MATDLIQRVQHARHLFFDGCTVPPHLVPDPVVRSWERSTQLGVRASDKVLFNPISHGDRRRAEERSRQLIDYAVPELERLYSALRPADWVLACLDMDGIVVRSIGSPDGSCKELARAFRRGVTLSEQSTGTTAPACALTDQVPITINANEHFLEEARVFSCAAVPLFGYDGRLMGALDATCRSDGHPVAVLESLQIAGRMIENDMLQDLPGAIHVCMHYRPDLLGTPLQGLLAFSEDGRLRGANQAARKLLGQRGSASVDFEALFDTQFAAAMDQLRRGSGTPLVVDASVGIHLHMRLAKPVAPRCGRAVRTTPVFNAQRAPAAVYDDARLKSMVADARRAFAHDLPVLVRGETGTGKEVLARGLHESGPRSKGAFVAVDCSSVPESLIEAELFGYEEGAFTGARRGGASGKFEQAQHGTLFLDEIGDMPIALQSRLLRVLQERVVTRVGGSRLIPLDISLICASHRDLRAMVDAGQFREDLYYRIDGIRVTLPPLRERSDISEIIDVLLQQDACGHSPLCLTAGARELLLGYLWPGNIRQLRHVIRRAVALAGDGAPIEPRHLPEEMQQLPHSVDAVHGLTLQCAERDAIIKTLSRSRGNLTATARVLGIGRSTLYRKLKAYGIDA